MNPDTSTNLEPNLTWKGQWLGYICLGMLVFFTWLPNSYYLMVSYPWIIIWQVGFLCLGIWAIWMLRQFKIPFKPLGYGLDWIVGLGLVAVILSGIFSQFKQVAAWNISLVLCYVCLLYILRNWIDKGFLTIDRLWKGICISGVISCIIGSIVWYPEFIAGKPRIQYPMGHPNFVAGYILLVLPLTVALAISNKSWQRIAGFAASSLMGVVLYFTGSRGGFLGIFVLAITATVFFILRSLAKKQWLQIAACLLALIIVGLITLNNPRVQQIIKISSPNSDAPVVQLQVDGQSRDRLFMLQAAVNILKHRPLLGVGAGNMSRIYNLYRPIETGMGATNVQQLHNTPVQIFGELGIVGLSVYLWFISWLVYLWFKLTRKLVGFSDRCLLYGIGSALLAYGVSSLTDYQLENISLSSLLIFLITALIKLLDRCDLKQTYSFGNYSRRWISLGIIAVLISSLLLWLPFSWAMKLAVSAENKFRQGNIEQGYAQISSAANLIPWDPTYNLLAGFRTLKIRDNINSDLDPKLYKELTELSLNHFQQVVKASPNDAPFNQMLGMLYRDMGDRDSAILYFRRSIQLQPRNTSYNYYLLGREYLLQNKTDLAINALALQVLIEPEFIICNIWYEPIFQRIKQPVFQEAFKLFSSLLEKLPSDNSSYNSIYEKYILLRWWSGQSLNNLEENRLRPIVKALILTESNPELALKIIEKQLQILPNFPSLLLLASWFKPQQYLTAYFDTEVGSNLKNSQQEDLKKINNQNLSVRVWLATQQEIIQSHNRFGLLLAYRNQYINQVSYTLSPQEIIHYSKVKLLDLFIEYDREVAIFDFLLSQLNAQKINIPRIIDNQYHLIN
jgi:O-antigen ligase